MEARKEKVEAVNEQERYEHSLRWQERMSIGIRAAGLGFIYLGVGLVFGDGWAFIFLGVFLTVCGIASQYFVGRNLGAYHFHTRQMEHERSTLRERMTNGKES